MNCSCRWPPGQPPAASKGRFVCQAAYPSPKHSLALGGRNLHLFRMHNTRFDVTGGMKGIGEAGIIGSPAAVISAVDDALRPYGVEPFLSMPVTPERIFRALHAR